MARQTARAWAVILLWRRAIQIVSISSTSFTLNAMVCVYLMAIISILVSDELNSAVYLLTYVSEASLSGCWLENLEAVKIKVERCGCNAAATSATRLSVLCISLISLITLVVLC